LADEIEDRLLPEGLAATADEPRGFAFEEMLACDACLRANPPTRMSCLYCGEKLPVAEERAAHLRPTLRPLEEWERGINVVLLPGAFEPTPEVLSEAAKFLRTDAERLQAIVEARTPLPVARAASDEEAELIVGRLGGLGFAVELLADEEVALDTSPPRRVRRCEFAADVLRGWTAAEESCAVSWGTVELVAVGIVLTKRVEVEERRGPTKPGEEIAEARSLFADEAVLEIYSAGDSAGWRIAADSFDYSCLGERMGLLAGENFRTLVAELRTRARTAVFDDSYPRLRQLLDVAWPPTERKESGGLKRERPGKFNTEAVTVVSNDAQFTRYARLRHRLRTRRRVGETP
jgi:hypothetical protein